jgi:hypothetical protein
MSMNHDVINVILAFEGVLGLGPVELWLLGGLTVVSLVALGRAAWTKRSMRSHETEIDPFRVFPQDTVRRPITPSPIQGLAWAPPSSGDEDDEPFQPAPRAQHSRPAPATPAQHFRPAPAPPAQHFRPEPAPPAQHFRPVPATPAPFPNEADVAPAPIEPPQRPNPGPAPARPSWSTAPAPRHEEVDEASETIRLPTAADGTVQLLPGMLTMTQGPEVGREYRFLRIGSQPIPEVTMGRASGPSYRHIHLPAVTVSRMHARIRYNDRNWRIANLSMTNPLRLNGHELSPLEESVLNDGDKIQLGEVELTYRDQRQ